MDSTEKVLGLVAYALVAALASVLLVECVEHAAEATKHL